MLSMQEPPVDDEYDDRPLRAAPEPEVTTERALLGTLLLNPHEAPALATALQPGDWYDPRNEAVWDALQAATRNGCHDVTLVGQEVTQHLARLNGAGRNGSNGNAPHYLLDLYADAGESLYINAYADTIRNAARLRTLQTVARRLMQAGSTTDLARADEILARSLDELGEAALRFGPGTGRRSEIEYVDIAGLFARERADVHWHVSPIIAAGRVTLLYSPGKAGKSMIAMEAAAALATGRPALGTEGTGEPVHVLYVDQEMTEDDWQARLTDMGYGVADAALGKYLHLAQLQSWPAMDTPAGGAAVHSEAKATSATVVIIDTVSKVISGEENSNDTAQAFYRNTLVNLKRDGIGTLVLDHTGKDISLGARGGSAKTDNIDLAFELLHRGRDLLTLRCTHARFHDDALLEPTLLKRMTGPLQHIIEDRPHTGEHGPGLRPTYLMEKVSRYVEANSGVSRKTIETAKLGKTDYVRMALDLLIQEAYIQVEKGTRGSHSHTSITPYREDDDEE